VARVKIRDRGAASDGERIRFTSAILSLWARLTQSLDALLPVLYLRGISTGDFQEALAALLGQDAPNLSPAVISRLTAEWKDDYDGWQKRDLSARRTSRSIRLSPIGVTNGSALPRGDQVEVHQVAICNSKLVQDKRKSWRTIFPYRRYQPRA